MSQHGSGFGGYGGGPPAGGPPGGGPPPGGGYPPGGYPPGGGQPPGGGGYPPGGGGYPPGGGGYPPGGGGYPPPGGGYPPGPGGPPGYGPAGGPQPGYGPPAGGYPAPAPAKKSNALMWVGIGCGGLFFLGLLGSGVAYYFTMKAAQSALAPLTTATPTPGSTATSTGTDSAGSPVSGACAKAAECCRKIVQKANSGAQAEAGCLGLKQLPEANCQLPLATYQRSAQLLGLTCE